MKTTLAVIATALAAAAPRAQAAPTPAQMDLAKKFAPLVYLADKEEYLPSSVEFHAQHVTLRCNKGNATGSVLDIKGTLPPAGEQADHCFLTTNEKMTGPNHIHGFFQIATAKVKLRLGMSRAAWS